MSGQSTKLTYLIAAEVVLRQARRPLSARELVDQAIADRLLPNATFAKTPHKSMQARLSMHILQRGEASVFVRTSSGRFYLRELLGEISPRLVRPFDRALSRERVLCIPRHNYEALLTFQGISDDAASLLQHLVVESRTAYLPRVEAENDSKYKQVVTYTLVQYQNHILSFQRGQFSRVASFLKGARCIGFGGHVTEADANIFGYADRGIRACAARELEEELRGGALDDLRVDDSELEVLGVLNDDSSDVGRKHVAVVLRYWVNDWPRWKSVREGETSVRDLKWTNFADGGVDINEFEYWSQMCFRRYFPELPAQRSQHRIVRDVDLQSDHLLLIVGTIGSGKTHTARLMAKRLGYAVVNSGQVVASLIGLPPVPETSREVFHKVAWDLVSTSAGVDRLAGALIEAARATGQPHVIIDGIRQLDTFERVRALWGGQVYTLFVQTPPELAFESYRQRENELSVREFMDLYDAMVERGVHDIARHADIIVYNWYGDQSHERALNALVRSLGQEPEAERERRRL